MCSAGAQSRTFRHHMYLVDVMAIFEAAPLKVRPAWDLSDCFGLAIKVGASTRPQRLRSGPLPLVRLGRFLD
jgi:hypothetical protein